MAFIVSFAIRNLLIVSQGPPPPPPEGEKQALTLIILSIENSRAKMCSDIQTCLTKKSINTTMQVAQSADIKAGQKEEYVEHKQVSSFRKAL